MINRVWVLKRKQWEPKERSGQKWKRMQVEVEYKLELDGSREDSWRVQGLQAITLGLLGLKESDKERNELQREQNSYLLRIAKHLESGLGPEEFEVLVEDSTMRE